jgi:hypothetical protein
VCPSNLLAGDLAVPRTPWGMCPNNLFAGGLAVP